MRQLFNYSQRQMGFRNVGNNSARQRKMTKFFFGWAVCKGCFTSILYKAKNGDDTKFYGTKNLSDHLKNCRTPSSPSINKYFKSKQGNIKTQQSDKDLMEENLLKMVVGSFLDNQGFHDTISHSIQIGAKYGNIQASDVLYGRVNDTWTFFTSHEGMQRQIYFNMLSFEG